MLEHAHDRRLKIVGLWSAQSDLDLGAAGPLSLGQQRIQEGAACVRIDLDQPGAIGGKVEVVTHEYANRPEIMSSDLWSPGQRRIAIAGNRVAASTACTIRSISPTLASDRNTGTFENRCVFGPMKVLQNSGSPTSRSSD